MTRSWLAFSALVLGACTPADPVTTPEPNTPIPSTTGETAEDTAEPKPAAPTVSLTLTPDTVTAGETVELSVTFENFTLVDPTASPPPTVAEGEGHYHVYADGVYLVAAWEPTVELVTAPEDAGYQFEIEVGLVDSGHTDLDPPVEATATLTVE